MYIYLYDMHSQYHHLRGVSFKDIFLQKLLARTMLDDGEMPPPPAPAAHMLLLGVNDCTPVLVDVALVWLPKLRAELDWEARPARARRLGREVLVDLDSIRLDREVDLDNTRPRLEAERVKPSPSALSRFEVTMGTPVAASRRRR